MAAIRAAALFELNQPLRVVDGIIGERISVDPHELISGQRIRGTWGGECDPDRDVPRLAALYRRGELPLERMLEKRYRLDEINMALDDLERGTVCRPLIEIDARQAK